MPDFQVVFVYENTRDAVGYTHTWYTEAADKAAAHTATIDWWPKVRNLLMDYTFLRQKRISEVGKPRDSKFFPVPGAGDNNGSFASATIPSVGYAECLLIRRDSFVGGEFAHLFLHDVPQAIFDRRQYPGAVMPVGWTTAFADLQTLVTTGAYMLKVKDTTVSRGFSLVDCETFDPIGETTRKVGRPFDRIHGKRRIA